MFVAFFGAGLASAAFSLRASGDTGSTFASWAEAVPAVIDQVAVGALAVAVPLLLAARRHMTRADLGYAVAGRLPGATWVRFVAWGLLALIAGGAVTAALATGSFPEGGFSYPNLTVNLLHAAQAGFIEECVVLAFVVTTLEQARRPRAEIVVVALLLRASYHIYYGPGVFGIFVWAAVFIWLFMRFRTIVPLVALHSFWDVSITLADRWRAVGGLVTLGYLTLFVAAFIVWLVERDRRRHPPGGGLAVHPPGWYPDPWGSGGWRWWNGWAWGPQAGTW